MTTRKFDQTLELSNDGKLSLFFLGSGSAFSKTFFQSNVLVVKGNDHLLIDCGTLCPYVVKTVYNSHVKDIKNLLITHPHADHVGGVEEMALFACYTNKNKINLVITDEFKKKLWNQTLRGGIQYSELGKMTFNDYFSQIKPVKIQSKPFEMYSVNLGKINFKLFRTRHVTTSKKSLRGSQLSYGILFEDRILFTGDTQFNPSQLEWFNKNYNLECIFHDCDVKGFATGVHASYEQLKTLPAELKSKMYLYHYNNDIKTISPEKDGFVGIVNSGFYYDF